MPDALRQLALIDTLLANWDLIRLRIGPLSPALAREFITLGQKLGAATAISEMTRIINDLLDLTKETPAASYVRELIGRASFGEAPSMRGPRVSGLVNPDIEAMIEAPAQAQESGANLGAVLGLSSALPLGVEQAPVFFATNRKPNDGAATGFSGDIAALTSYGLASVTIPTGIHQLGKLEAPSWWNCLANKKDQEKYFTLGALEGLKQAEFASRLESAAQIAGTKELLILLHGYNVTFEEAALRAAQFAHDSKFRGIVVLFSWPSQGSLQGYAADEDRAMASGDRLAAFLGALENGPWQRVHLLAHSMGNRVMLAGLADNPRPRLPLGQLVFAAADVYVAVFEEKFPKLQNAGKLSATSYASKKDRALWLSSLLHKGTRVGIVEGAPYVTDNLESIDATSVDRGMLGHGYWSDQRVLITDLQRLLQDGLSADQRQLDRIGKYWAFPK